MISIALPILLAATSTPVGFTDDYDAALARAKKLKDFAASRK